jgi:hypothetical protein
MGLLDFLRGLFFGGETTQCPSCGAAGARKTADDLIHCKNPACPYFDAGLRFGGRLQRRLTSVPTQGDFRPEVPVSIRYVNYVGQSRDFSAELGSIMRKNNHLVARVAPTGKKIALSRERIQNLADVEAKLPPRVESGQAWPTPRERQIMGYHKKYGTTSARYEQVRAKYPKW